MRDGRTQLALRLSILTSIAASFCLPAPALEDLLRLGLAALLTPRLPDASPMLGAVSAGLLAVLSRHRLDATVVLASAAGGLTLAIWCALSGAPEAAPLVGIGAVTCALAAALAGTSRRPTLHPERHIVDVVALLVGVLLLAILHEDEGIGIRLIGLTLVAGLLGARPLPRAGSLLLLAALPLLAEATASSAALWPEHVLGGWQAHARPLQAVRLKAPAALTPQVTVHFTAPDSPPDGSLSRIEARGPVWVEIRCRHAGLAWQERLCRSILDEAEVGRPYDLEYTGWALEHASQGRAHRAQMLALDHAIATLLWGDEREFWRQIGTIYPRQGPLGCLCHAGAAHTDIDSQIADFLTRAALCEPPAQSGFEAVAATDGGFARRKSWIRRCAEDRLGI